MFAQGAYDIVAVPAAPVDRSLATAKAESAWGSPALGEHKLNLVLNTAVDATEHGKHNSKNPTQPKHQPKRPPSGMPASALKTFPNAPKRVK